MKFFLRLTYPYQKALLIIFIFALAQNANAQQVFTPSETNVPFLTTLAAGYEKIYKSELISLPSQNRKDYEEIYRQRWNNIKEKFDNKEIYTSTSAQQYLNSLINQIVNANPILRKNTFIAYFSRSEIPNAEYIGEGIILFNLGLFPKLNNESQLVFVLCHEISHLYLQHSENAIRKYVTAINSEEVQKELQKINKSEFKKRDQLEKLVKGLTFNSRRHSRDHESQADSMAIEFMHNTKFDISEALTALGLLDSIDKETLNTNLCLEKLFDSKDYPFQKKWTAKEEGLLGGHTEVSNDGPLIDSLKTHPDCQARIEMLKPLVNKYNSKNSFKNFIDKAKFDELRNAAQYEIIEYAYFTNNYSKSLYSALNLLQTHSSDAYLITQVGKIFNGFYDAQKKHTLGKLIDLPSPYLSSSYNALLQFIQNLYLEDFAQLSYNFLKNYQQELGYYSPYKDSFNTIAQIIKTQSPIN